LLVLELLLRAPYKYLLAGDCHAGKVSDHPNHQLHHVIASNTLDHIGLTGSSVRSSIGVLDGIFIDAGLAFS
jgi:hypothetical protein